MSSYLNASFMTEAGKKHQVRISDANLELLPSAIEDAIIDIRDANIFESSIGKLTSINGVDAVTVETHEVF